MAAHTRTGLTRVEAWGPLWGPLSGWAGRGLRGFTYMPSTTCPASGHPAPSSWICGRKQPSGSGQVQPGAGGRVHGLWPLQVLKEGRGAVQVDKILPQGSTHKEGSRGPALCGSVTWVGSGRSVAPLVTGLSFLFFFFYFKFFERQRDSSHLLSQTSNAHKTIRGARAGAQSKSPTGGRSQFPEPSPACHLPGAGGRVGAGQQSRCWDAGPASEQLG